MEQSQTGFECSVRYTKPRRNIEEDPWAATLKVLGKFKRLHRLMLIIARDDIKFNVGYVFFGRHWPYPPVHILRYLALANNIIYSSHDPGSVRLHFKAVAR